MLVGVLGVPSGWYAEGMVWLSCVNDEYDRVAEKIPLLFQQLMGRERRSEKPKPEPENPEEEA